VSGPTFILFNFFSPLQSDVAVDAVADAVVVVVAKLTFFAPFDNVDVVTKATKKHY